MTAADGTDHGALRRGPLVAAIALGIGLALAPAVFGMFTAAPLGGQMIEDFRPFMDPGELAAFDDHLGTVGGAADDLRGSILPRLESAGTAAPDGLSERFPATATFLERWPAIRTEMSAMLDDIGANVDNFRAVDALPPFDLFPWFFVAPGLLTVGLAALALRGAPSNGRRPTAALAVTGVALIAAPAVFGMFARAPQGGRMIDDLRPLMTRQQVTSVQGHFVTLGAAEGELRTQVLPALDAAGAAPREVAPDATAFIDAWPGIAADMAPMVGAMGDNLDNFAALDGLPPFALFPWFFVAPGILLIGLAAGAAAPLIGRPSLDKGVGTDGPVPADSVDPDRPSIHMEGST